MPSSVAECVNTHTNSTWLFYTHDKTIPRRKLVEEAGNISGFQLSKGLGNDALCKLEKPGYLVHSVRPMLAAFSMICRKVPRII
jgi:hypothetical protein